MDENTKLVEDAKLIDDLGGPSALAERLGYSKSGGPQRVQNWKTRGIPAQVKIDFPDIFLRPREQAA